MKRDLLLTEMQLQIEPVAWQRVKRARHGKSYVPGKTRRYKNQIALLIKRASTLHFDSEPLALDLDFIVKCPKKRRPFAHKRPDIDNFIKGVLDAANGVLWKDDAQIVDIHARKLYDLTHPHGRIILKLWSVST